MAKILVLYYSSWGHMEQMAKSAAEGAREAGADGDDQARQGTGAGGGRQGRLLQARPGGADRRSAGTRDYDGFIFGISTRYGMMAAQLKNFLDQTGPLWVKGALVNKVATVMSSTATQHGGAELAILITTQAIAAASRHDHRAAVLCLSRASRATTWCAAARPTA